MPNFTEHCGLSAVVSAGTYFWMCRYYHRQPTLGELLVCEGIGLTAGVAPDIFEPATDPHHRALGHSVALGTVLTKFAITNCSRENSNWEEFVKIATAVVTVSYLAHLIADALTPRSIPLLGRLG
jgi:inner membrane protein